MTLTKAIEVARDALQDIMSRNAIQHWFNTDKQRDALAALPDKPMTEDEIIHILNSAGVRDFKTAFHALKAANVLYVEEEK